MPEVVTIEGREVAIAWTIEAQRRVAYRASKHEVSFPEFRSFTDPRKAHAAYMDALWLLLPEDEFRRHATPEELSAKIDQEADAPQIVTAVLSVVASIVSTAEKKTSSGKSPLRASNSASAKKSGTRSTRTKRNPTSKRGKSGKSASTSATRH